MMRLNDLGFPATEQYADYVIYIVKESSHKFKQFFPKTRDILERPPFLLTQNKL